MNNPLDARLVIEGLLGKLTAAIVVGLTTWILYNSFEQSKVIASQSEQFRSITVQLEKMDHKLEILDEESDDRVRREDLNSAEARLQSQISELRQVMIRFSDRVRELEKAPQKEIR